MIRQKKDEQEIQNSQLAQEGFWMKYFNINFDLSKTRENSDALFLARAEGKKIRLISANFPC